MSKRIVWFAGLFLLAACVSWAGNADFMITQSGSTTPLTSATIGVGDTLSVDVWLHSDSVINTGPWRSPGGVCTANIFLCFDQTTVNPRPDGYNGGGAAGYEVGADTAINKVLGMDPVSGQTVLDTSWAASGCPGGVTLYPYFSAGDNKSGPYPFGNFTHMQWALGSSRDMTDGYFDEIRYTLTGLQAGMQTIGLWSSGRIDPMETTSVTLLSYGEQDYPAGPGVYALTNPATITVIPGERVSAPIPEPGSWLVLGTGVMGLVGFSLRRRG